MCEVILSFFAIVLTFVLPGLSLVVCFRIHTINIMERLFYAISLSFVLSVGIGLVLAITIGVTPVTVLISFLAVSSPGLVATGLRAQQLLRSMRTVWRKATEFGRGLDLRLVLALTGVVTVTAINWSYALGTHPIDMGEHVYWAKVIIASSRMPNYYLVEPLDQAVKFTYGAHLVLAQFSFMSGLPIEDYSWIPTLVGSIAILMGIALFAARITRSTWIGVLAGGLYGSAVQPFGYIERGNLPDIAGYLLIVSSLYSILLVRKRPSVTYAMGLTTVSVIPFHQLASVILPIVIVVTILFSIVRAPSELVETLRSLLGSRSHLIFWTMMLILTVVYAGTVTYVSTSAASQLVTGNWRPYVSPIYHDPLVTGLALGLMGTAGLVSVLRRKTLEFILLLAWASALIFLANALLVGIPIPDPSRFLWRLTEPFSISGALLAWLVVNGRSRNPGICTSRHARVQRTWVTVGSCVIIGLITLQIGGLVSPTLQGVPTALSLPARYRPVESFYQDDKKIGQWLAANSSYAAVIVNDADVDQTATWIEPYSMRLHFLFRADFATIVAPANYVEIYKSIEILYKDPSDMRVPQIIQRYSVTYVIAHADEIKLFEVSPYFGGGPVFQSGTSAVFAPITT